jgi:DNA-binding HxlR family transcriptional regulator
MDKKPPSTDEFQRPRQSYTSWQQTHRRCRVFRIAKLGNPKG